MLMWRGLALALFFSIAGNACLNWYSLHQRDKSSTATDTLEIAADSSVKPNLRRSTAPPDQSDLPAGKRGIFAFQNAPAGAARFALQ